MSRENKYAGHPSHRPFPRLPGETASDTQRRKANWKKEQGICVRCWASAVEGKTLCEQHAEEQTAATMRLRAKREAAGKCPECGKRKPAKGRIACKPCSKRLRSIHERYYARHAETIIDRQRAAKKLRRDAREAAGLCTSCGLRKPRPRRKSCGKCAAAAAARLAEYRARRKNSRRKK